MAEKRMFSKIIIDSDPFLDMPLSAQCLYFHLSMRADDDGFVNSPRKIQRLIGASDDDLKLLVMKSFVITFDTGIIVIKHWRINNYLRNDRYKPTVFQEEMACLTTKKNGTYEINCSDGGFGIPSVNQVVDQVDTQYRLDKSSIDKDREVENLLNSNEFNRQTNVCQTNVENDEFYNSLSENKANPNEIKLCAEHWNKLSSVGVPSISRITSGSNRYSRLNARIKEYGLEEVLKSIDSISESDYLCGNSKSGWVIDFDWFVRPNNFIKVHDGNYKNKQKTFLNDSKWGEVGK